MVVVDKAQLRNRAGFLGPHVHRIKHAGRGGGGILRVGRHYQNPCHAVGLQGIELRGNRGAAVAHRPAHHHMVAKLGESRLKQGRLFFSPQFQRRAFRRPDAGVFGR